MDKAKVKTRVVLQQDFAQSHDGLQMPRPLAPLVLVDAHDIASATVRLPPAATRYYPLNFQGLLMGDVLRAHYDCHCSDKIVGVRFDRAELQRLLKEIDIFKNEPVAAWNMVQMKGAFLLMDFVPPSGSRGLDRDVVTSFQKEPRAFCAALEQQRAPVLH